MTASASAAVAAYLAGFPPPIRKLLRAIRATVRKAAPQAEERISYGMPSLFQHGVLVHYAAFKHHIGLYPPVRDPALRRRLARYAGPKANLQFSYADPLPLALIAQVVRAQLRSNLQREAARRSARR